MLTAAATMQIARPLLSRLVEFKERQHGSRMTAYDEAGQAIGASGSWVRKFLGRQDVRLEAHELLNLVTAYERLCDRLERDAEEDLRVARTIRENKRHAALGSALEAALRVGDPEGSGAQSSAALVDDPDGDAHRRGLSAADHLDRGATGKPRSALGRAAGELAQ